MKEKFIQHSDSSILRGKRKYLYWLLCFPCAILERKM